MLNELELLGKALTGTFVTKALLKDYAQVVARLENSTPEEVENRVLEEAQRIQNQFREESEG